MGARVHAYGVCDDPEYFYDFIQGILDDMGATPSVIGISQDFCCAVAALFILEYSNLYTVSVAEAQHCTVTASRMRLLLRVPVVGCGRSEGA